MDITEAQTCLAAVGTDSPPTAAQLREARSVFIAAAKTAKDARDKVALASMLEAVKTTDQAIVAAEELEAQSAAELDALVADIPELAAEAPAEDSTDPAPESGDDAPRMLSIAEAVQRLGLGPASTQVVEPEVDSPTQTLTIAGEDRSDASWGDLGQAFAKFAKSQLRGGRTTLATFKTEYANQLPGNAAANTRVLDDLMRRSGESAVVAAGGCCSLAEPIRDQPMLASLARPIADGLPTIGATYGKVTLFPPVCLPQDGVGIWTCQDDADVDPEDPDTWKTCTHIECADPDIFDLDAIYHCITIGNFQQKFNPERWDAILHAVAAQQARIAEAKLFDDIANSALVTQHGVTDTGSVYVTVFNALVRAKAIINQNQRYEGRRFGAIAPSWLADAADLDLAARALSRGRAVETISLDAALRAQGIDVIWSPDVNPIEPGGQIDGPLTSFPAEADVVLYVDGGVFRLDGGEINLGTDIRDHDLNRQNSVAAFGESFEGALVRSCDTKHLTIPVTVCDFAECGTPSPISPTGATAGEPGFFTPIGAVLPPSLAALQGGGITASPATLWAEDAYVTLGDSSSAHWDGSAWVAGVSPGE